MQKGRAVILSYQRAPASRNQTRYTGDLPYLVHYKYDDVGYKERMYLKRAKGFNYFDFSTTKHVELGYMEAPRTKEVVL